MKELQFLEVKPLSQNKPKKLIIFLHGYGAAASDLIGLSRDFGNIIESAHFVSPNAPEKIPHPLMEGYQWFSLENQQPEIIYPQICSSVITLK